MRDDGIPRDSLGRYIHHSIVCIRVADGRSLIRSKEKLIFLKGQQQRPDEPYRGISMRAFLREIRENIFFMKNL